MLAWAVLARMLARPNAALRDGNYEEHEHVDQPIGKETHRIPRIHPQGDSGFAEGWRHKSNHGVRN